MPFRLHILEWHWDINKCTHQSIGLNKAYSVQYITDIFELRLMSLWIVITSRHPFLGEVIQNVWLHTEALASTRDLKRLAGEASLIIHGLDDYVLIKPNKAIEHTFTLWVLAGIGPETSIYWHQTKSTINTTNTIFNFFHLISGTHSRTAVTGK